MELKNRKQNRRQTGTIYEEKASQFLKENGYQILQKNFYTKFGEIDIVAKDGDYLVFVEVKYRKNGGLFAALEAVTIEKQKRMILAAKVYLYTKEFNMDVPCRFDVIGFQGEEMIHIKNAIEVS